MHNALFVLALLRNSFVPGNEAEFVPLANDRYLIVRNSNEYWVGFACGDGPWWAAKRA